MLCLSMFNKLFNETSFFRLLVLSQLIHLNTLEKEDVVEIMYFCSYCVKTSTRSSLFHEFKVSDKIPEYVCTVKFHY